MMKRARWDDDVSGERVADAVAFLPPLDKLSEAMRRSGWVTEDPEAHLLPHLQQSSARDDAPLAIERASSEEGVFEVWLGPRRQLSAGDLRHAVFALLASVAEGVTFVHECMEPQRTVFEVTTGMLDDQTTFQSHGHTIRFSVGHPAE